MKETKAQINSQRSKKNKKETKKLSEVTPEQKMKKAGRKSWVPDYGKIENWATQGLLDKEIAALSGITATTFCEKKTELPELKAAIELGKAKGIAACSQKLLSLALAGNERSLHFYLERIGGRRNVTTLEPPKKPIHEMTDRELLALINGEQIVDY